MKQHSCHQEPRVLAALRSGAWDIGLREHAKDCPVCADVLLVTEFLQGQSKAAKAEAALPNAAFLWWKSGLLARQITVQRATRPIAFARSVAVAVCSVTLLWFLLGTSAAREWASIALGSGISLQAVWRADWGAVALLSLGAAVLSAILASVYLARA